MKLVAAFICLCIAKVQCKDEKPDPFSDIKFLLNDGLPLFEEMIVSALESYKQMVNTSYKVWKEYKMMSPLIREHSERDYLADLLDDILSVEHPMHNFEAKVSSIIHMDIVKLTRMNDTADDQIKPTIDLLEEMFGFFKEIFSTAFQSITTMGRDYEQKAEKFNHYADSLNVLLIHVQQTIARKEHEMADCDRKNGANRLQNTLVYCILAFLIENLGRQLLLEALKDIKKVYFSGPRSVFALQVADVDEAGATECIRELQSQIQELKDLEKTAPRAKAEMVALSKMMNLTADNISEKAGDLQQFDEKAQKLPDLIVNMDSTKLKGIIISMKQFTKQLFEFSDFIFYFKSERKKYEMNEMKLK